MYLLPILCHCKAFLDVDCNNYVNSIQIKKNVLHISQFRDPIPVICKFDQIYTFLIL